MKKKIWHNYLTDSDLDFYLTERKEIQAKCKKCYGVGRIELELCECSEVADWKRILETRNFPIKYWDYNFSNMTIRTFEKKKAIDFVDNYEKAIAHSIGMAFMGNFGIGKTTLATCIGMELLIRGYDGMWLTAQGLVDILNPHNTVSGKSLSLKKKIPYCNFFIIDELGKERHKEGSTFVIGLLEEFYRSCINKNVPVIFSCNLEEKDMEAKYKASFKEVFSHAMLVEMKGDNLRPELKDSLLDKLHGDVPNYLESEVFRSNARRFSESYKNIIPKDIEEIA